MIEMFNLDEGSNWGTRYRAAAAAALDNAGEGAAADDDVQEEHGV